MICSATKAFALVPVFQSSVPVFAFVSSPSSHTIMYGINFSPYMDGQNPNLRSPISESQIRERMEVVAPHTQWVRTFSMVDGLEKAGAIAHSLGLKVALGAWIGPESNPTGLAMNRLNIDNLIAAGQRGEADLLIVGSEALLRKNVTEQKLISYVNDVKAGVPGIPVAVADTDEKLLQAPSLMIAADALFVNIYPFWERTSADWALYNVLARYRRMEAAMPGKPIYLSETGWPSCGEPLGLAIPDPVSASAYFLGYQTLVSSLNIPGFYFEAFDESWKVAAEGTLGSCWGIWDKEGNLKPGNNAYFQGALASNTWTGFPPVDGPGTPTIIISSAPSYGDSSTWVSGKAVHVSPDDHHISMYIHINSNNRWYMKPYASTPYFIMQPDGNWRSPMVTGGSDFIADKIRVYLFPGPYIPQIVFESINLPAEFEIQSLSKMEIFRTPNALSASITSPVNGAIVSVPTPIRVNAESASGVTNVIFYLDGVALSTDSFHPFEFLWDPAGTTSGVHALSARVTEITGDFTETSIQVSKP